MHVDLSDDGTAALTRLLRKAIDDDRYPLPPLKAYEPPRFVRGRRRR
jgi:hypothetical protein